MDHPHMLKKINIYVCIVVLCRETPTPFQNFTIFLPVMLYSVRKQPAPFQNFAILMPIMLYSMREYPVSLFEPWSNAIFQFQSTLVPYQAQAPNCVDISTS